MYALNHTLDMYVCGAVPPYNDLLGGKLCALVAASREVGEHFLHRHHRRASASSPPPTQRYLLGVTTMSAFGRSSIYNGLIVRGRRLFQPIGYTQGYGVQHFADDTYAAAKAYLTQTEPSRKLSGFGTGPRVRWQVMQLVLDRLQISASRTLQHGFTKQVFWTPHWENWWHLALAPDTRRQGSPHSFDLLAQYWKERWLSLRASRVSAWKERRGAEFLAEVLSP
jgi:hypothetical protein